MHRIGRTIAAWGAIAPLVAFAPIGCGVGGPPPPQPTKPVGRPVNVLVVTLDTTRPDHLGCGGSARVKTPRLDRLAADGAYFERAFTPVPSTFPSHAALFTSRHPATTGVHDNAVYFLGPEQLTLAEILQEKGYATGAFVSAFVLDHQFKLDQGFEAYDDEVDQPLFAGDVSKMPKDLPEDQRKWQATMATAYQRRGDVTTRKALAWAAGLGSRPMFLWVHYFDAHQPYQPPAPHDREYDPDYHGAMNGDRRLFFLLQERGGVRRTDVEHMVALYDGEISWLDEQVGALLDGLAKLKRLDETLVVVVGDHGEGLGEHQQIFEHNSEVYDEAVHVPLIVWRPDAHAKGEKSDALVRTIDVAPTVLDWLHLAPPSSMQGHSLLAFTDADAAKRAAAEGCDEVLLEALRGRQVNAVDESLLGLRGPDWKVVLTMGQDDEVKRVELYDLAKDRGEKHDLSKEQPERAAKLRDKALGLHRQLPKPESNNARDLGAIDNAALKALGYTH